VAELDRYWASYRAETAGVIAIAQARGVNARQAASDADTAAAFALSRKIDGGLGLLDPVVKWAEHAMKAVRRWYRGMSSRARARARQAIENQEDEEEWDQMDPFMAEPEVPANYFFYMLFNVVISPGKPSCLIMAGRVFSESE
jgi:hypothetical protein